MLPGYIRPDAFKAPPLLAAGRGAVPAGREVVCMFHEAMLVATTSTHTRTATSLRTAQWSLLMRICQTDRYTEKQQQSSKQARARPPKP